ncbi:hypothetical protein ACFL35_04335 [Candidatus Riflebacteria bacterium]
MSNYEHSFFKALFLTCFLETIALLILTRFAIIFKKIENISAAKIIFAGTFASFATLPYLWFILPVYFKDIISIILVGEPLVILLEALFFLFFLPITCSYALLFSFLCNLFSLVPLLFKLI